MKKQLLFILVLFVSIGIKAQIKTSEVEVRIPTSSAVNEISGETEISGLLKIKSSSVGGTIGGSFDNLILEQSGANVGFTLKSLSTHQTGIAFGDESDHNMGRILYHHNGDYMSFWTKDVERLRMLSNGNVGIGTATPSGKLHVHNSSTGSTVNTNYDNLIIEQNATNIGLSFLAANTNNATIAFGDPEDNDVGRIRYHHPDNSLSFFTSGAERMRIRDNGWVGIGTTGPLGKLHVRSGNTQGSVSSNYDDIVVEHASGHVGLSFLSMNNRINAITFSDNDATNKGNIYYHHSDDRMGFRVNGAERVRILNNGNIGIGTTTPGGRLHVYNSATGGSAAGNYDNLIVEQNSAHIGMTFLSKNTNNAGIAFSDGDAQNRGIILYGHGDDRMAFYTAGAERVRILSNGNVGIGTSAPTSRVTIDEPYSRLTMGAIDGEFRIRSTRLNNYTYSDLVLSAQENVILMPDGGQTAYSGQGKVGIGTSNPIDLLTLQQSGPSGLTFVRSNHDQYRMYLSSSKGLLIRNGTDGRDEMMFDGTGKIGIGTSTPSQKLHVNGNVLANNVSVSSDRRWKKNINKIEDASLTLNTINPVSYKLRTEEFPEKDFDDKIHYGVIAQEIEKVLPELVKTDNEGYKSVDYMGMIGLLVKGFQERGEEIERLKAELAAERANDRDELTALNDRLSRLEALLMETDDQLEQKQSVSGKE